MWEDEAYDPLVLVARQAEPVVFTYKRQGRAVEQPQIFSNYA